MPNALLALAENHIFSNVSDKEESLTHTQLLVVAHLFSCIEHKLLSEESKPTADALQNDMKRMGYKASSSLIQKLMFDAKKALEKEVQKNKESFETHLQ